MRYRFIYKIVEPINDDIPEYSDSLEFDHITVDMLYGYCTALADELYRYPSIKKYKTSYVYVDASDNLHIVTEEEVLNDYRYTRSSHSNIIKPSLDLLNALPIISKEQLEKSATTLSTKSETIENLERQYTKASIFGLKSYNIMVNYIEYLYQNAGVTIAAKEKNNMVILTDKMNCIFKYCFPIMESNWYRDDRCRLYLPFKREARDSLGATWQICTRETYNKKLRKKSDPELDELSIDETTLYIESFIIGNEIYIPSFIKTLEVYTCNTKLKITGGEGLEYITFSNNMAKYLEHLDLSEANLSNLADLEISECRNLKSVNFGDNDVRHLDIYGGDPERVGSKLGNIKFHGSNLSEFMKNPYKGFWRLF